ncbi:MAG: hypothetical protein P1V51_21040 [Deltaproteobacteria bacterium]|nr:hypothetical protein [Deltaproteobacteria bacterium]
MNDPVTLWILAGGAGLVAAVLGLAWRGAHSRLEATSAELEKSKATLGKLEKKVESQRESAESRSAELEELRKKLQKARKRTASVRQEQSSDSSRQQELGEELEAAKATIDRLHEELDGLREAAGSKPARKKNEKSEKSERPAAEKEAAPREAKPVTDEERDRLEQKAAKAESTAAELRKQVEETEHELKRARGRAETNHRVYLVTKGELEAVNDKLHTLERHLGTNSFRDLLRAAGAQVGSGRVTAHVPLDPEATPGESAEASLAADAAEAEAELSS